MSDELGRIEDAKGQRDLGVFGYRIYLGAVSEGASPAEALAVVTAFFEGSIRGNQSEGEGDA
jgi:hypothetical protein